LVVGHLGCVHSLAIVNSAAINIVVNWLISKIQDHISTHSTNMIIMMSPHVHILWKIPACTAKTMGVKRKDLSIIMERFLSSRSPGKTSESPGVHGSQFGIQWQEKNITHVHHATYKGIS
jgi:hypothetical protein